MVELDVFIFYFSFKLLFFKGGTVWAAPAKAVTLEALEMDGHLCVATGMGFVCMWVLKGLVYKGEKNKGKKICQG